jgi:hypothetical protein
MSYIGNQPISAAFLTDTFSGTGAQVAFTMTVAPANTSSIIVAVTGVVQDPSTYSVSGTTLTFSAAPPSGTSNISVRYLGIPASGVTTTAYRTVTNTTATSGQTSFTIPSYTVGYVDVYRNGVYLPTTDYTATTGTTVVLGTGATTGDTITTISFYVSSVLNAIPATAGAISSTYLASSLTLTTPIVSTTMGVGNATPSTSGSGITFPATQSASTNVNTLDDYEEGTWTPTLRGDSTAGTYTPSSVLAYYTKIGNQVTCWAAFNLSAASGGSGYAQFGGLPFSYKASSAITGTIQLNSVTIGTYNYVTLRNDSGSATTTMSAQPTTNASGGANSPISGYTTSSSISYCVTYTV